MVSAHQVGQTGTSNVAEAAKRGSRRLQPATKAVESTSLVRPGADDAVLEVVPDLEGWRQRYVSIQAC